MTTIATITHDVNGIMMDLNGRLTSWPNVTWLASAHARLMIESEEINQRTGANCKECDL